MNYPPFFICPLLTYKSNQRSSDKPGKSYFIKIVIFDEWDQKSLLFYFDTRKGGVENTFSCVEDQEDAEFLLESFLPFIYPLLYIPLLFIAYVYFSIGIRFHQIIEQKTIDAPYSIYNLAVVTQSHQFRLKKKSYVKKPSSQYTYYY